MAKVFHRQFVTIIDKNMTILYDKNRQLCKVCLVLALSYKFSELK